jgi:hypothetical protein
MSLQSTAAGDSILGTQAPTRPSLGRGQHGERDRLVDAVRAEVASRAGTGSAAAAAVWATSPGSAAAIWCWAVWSRVTSTRWPSWTAPVGVR